MVCLSDSGYHLVHCYCCIHRQGKQNLWCGAIDIYECFIEEPTPHICCHHVRQGIVWWHDIVDSHWTEPYKLDSGANVFSKNLVGGKTAQRSNAILHAAMGQCNSFHLRLNTYLNMVNQRFSSVKQSTATSTNVVIMQRLTGGPWEYWLSWYIYRSMHVGLPPSLHQSWIPHLIYSKLAIYQWHCNILGYTFDGWCMQFNSSCMVCWPHMNGMQMCK